MVQRRAAGVGTYWPDAAWPSDKVLEELQELDEAASHDHRIEEYGDLLFAMVNLGRHLAVDAESALRHANAKFTRRFQAMEKIGRASCRERVCQYVSISVVAVSLKKKK